MSKSFPEDAVDLPSHFLELREKAGYTREEIAGIADCHPRTVYRWDRGETSPPKLLVDRLRAEIYSPQSTSNDGVDYFRFIDLFAGIGGLRMGFEETGGQCVFTSEWNKYARETYAANFDMDEDHPFAGDIQQVDATQIPSHELLLAGFPCQPFSIAGVSKKNALGRAHGFEDETQGTLFFDIKRILAHHRPAAFLLENVKNLRSHDKGNTFRVIRHTLEEELGYTISSRIINAKSFVPQNRERIFIAGFLHNVDFDFEKLHVPDIKDGPKLRSILHPEDGTETPEPPYTTMPNGEVNGKYTLSPKLWTYLQNYAAKHKAKGNGFGFGLVGPEDTTRTLSARYYKDGSEILIRQSGRRPRRLTPRECARLMGFDQKGQPPFKIPVSDTQAYKQFGNAVAVPLVAYIAQYMKPYIMEAIRLKYDQSKQLPLFAQLASND